MRTIIVSVLLLGSGLALAKSNENVLWIASDDLDGNGKRDKIVLSSSDVGLRPAGDVPLDPSLNVQLSECTDASACAAVLRVGKKSWTLPINGGLFRGIDISIIDIDTSDKRKEILIDQRSDDAEDPWHEFWVVFYDGKTLTGQKLWVGGGYSTGAVTVSGKGVLTLLYAVCPVTTTVSYRKKGNKLKEVDRIAVTTAKPEDCAACPFVYVDTGGAMTYQGEILRNLSRASLYGEQALVLGQTAELAKDQVIVVELREEKDETTYLDEVYLDVDGVRVEPNECADADFCAADHRYRLLDRGDVLRLTFSVGAAGGRAKLMATGYYLPH